MKNLPLIIVVAFLVVSSTPGFAQKTKTASSEKSELRIAIVDVEKIAKELPEAVEADKRLTEMRNKYLDTIKLMEQKFKDKFDAYNKNKAMLTADAQKKEEDELRNMQQQYSTFQEENFGAQGTIARKRDELLKPILDKIQDAIQSVAKEDKFNFVFDRKATSVLVYADDKFDVTHKIIDRMKRGH